LTDINALCDEYLRLSYHGLRAKDKSFNAEFDTQFDTTLAPINVVPQDIGRVILNLINNAFYAVNERQKKDKDSGYKPRVTLTTRQEGNQVVIEVADNGTGMPDQVKEKIFQPFFTTKPTGEGTGLGLSLSYDIVIKGHGGTMEVMTKEGEYTNFVLRIPT
ncbi:MAG: GHKL domain-containing protein, partial [Chitinophagaceae bacterium]|nr:GHKL domain-containing protein [Chitinophagaceae bacterium]